MVRRGLVAPSGRVVVGGLGIVTGDAWLLVEIGSAAAVSELGATGDEAGSALADAVPVTSVAARGDATVGS